MDVHDRFRADVAASERGRVAEISAATGIPDSTLRDVIYLDGRRLSYSHAKALEAFYAAIDAARAPVIGRRVTDKPLER